MEQNNKRSKILYTVLAILLILSVLPVAIVGWQLAKLNEDTLRGNEQRFQLDAVLDKAKQISLYVTAYRDQIGAFARSLEIAGGISILENKKVNDARLIDAINTDRNLCALVITPLSQEKIGQAIIASNPNLITEQELKGSLAQEAYNFIIKSKPNEYYVSNPILIKSSNESAIVLAAPIINTDATIKNSMPEGMVLAVVSLGSVFNFVAKNTAGMQETEALLKSGQPIFCVVDSKGRILAHPDQQVVFSDQSTKLKIVDDWLKSEFKVTEAGHFEIQENGKTFPMLGAYTSAEIAPGKELGVISMVNENAAYASVGQMVRKTLFVSVITVLVALIVGTFLAIRITSPIETLALGAKAIATGDFSRRIKVRTKNEIGELASDFNTMAEHIQQYISELRKAAEENRMLFIGTVRALAEAIDGKDAYTRGHSERVMRYSVLIAQYMTLSDDEIEDIRIAGILHDVGKIGIDDKILKKPAALTDEEYRIMKQHPQIGAKIMSEIPQMKRYIPGMFYHHECLDGKGYPLGLRGDQIPLMARIISVADVFDAMTTNRPYQRAMDTEVAVERIKSFVGTRYDNHVVEALVGALHAGKLDEVLQSYATTMATA